MAKQNIVNPTTFALSFSEAAFRLPVNETISRLGRDYNTLAQIGSYLKEMGQTRFVNLAKNCAQSRISWALYAGDGIVTKIIPSSFCIDNSFTAFQLPAITQGSVKSEDGAYLIKTYPWVSPRNVTQADVEVLRSQLTHIGFDFNKSDDQPKNVHRLPDKEGTLVGIDADMYHATQLGQMARNPSLTEQWKKVCVSWDDYVRKIFPIYDKGVIPSQTENTNFSLCSIHDPIAAGMSFTLPSDEAQTTEEPEQKTKKRRRWWMSRLFSNDEPEGPSIFQ